MNIRLIFFTVVIGGLLASCHLDPVIGKKQAAHEADGVLFYRQKHIADTFIDSILTNPGNEARLKIILIPAHKNDLFKTIKGFRIQIFASADSLNALTIKATASKQVEDTVYFVHEKGLYKLQVGDFPYRMEAETMKQRLKGYGYGGSWIVETLIKISIDSISGVADSISVQDKLVQPTADNYKIQILATSDEARALTLVAELNEKFGLQCFYEETGGLFKVFAGNFTIKSAADSALQKIRNSGYPDAWLVYKK